MGIKGYISCYKGIARESLMQLFFLYCVVIVVVVTQRYTYNKISWSHTYTYTHLSECIKDNIWIKFMDFTKFFSLVLILPGIFCILLLMFLWIYNYFKFKSWENNPPLNPLSSPNNLHLVLPLLFQTLKKCYLY